MKILKTFRLVLGLATGLAGLSAGDAEAQAPVLQVTNIGQQITLNWPSSSANCTVQTTSSLMPPVTWSNLTLFKVPNGAKVTAVTSAKEASQFFRLAEPSELPFSQVASVFQFAIFYNFDLEINPGAAFVVAGRSHSNGNIWATGSSSGAPLTFSNTAYAAGTVSNLPSPLDPVNHGRSGNVNYIISSNNPASHARPLYLYPASLTGYSPTNGIVPLLDPPAIYAPPNYAEEYSTNGLLYIRNDADIVIVNPANGTNGSQGTNIVVYYQNPYNAPNYLSRVQPDVLVASNVVGSAGNFITNLVYAYTFVTNVSFYDYREGRTIQAVQVDVAKFDSWLVNTSATGGYQYEQLNQSGNTSKNHVIDSIYIDNFVPATSHQLAGVRLINGQQLPFFGLTVATLCPIYVLGNYNTTTNGLQFSTVFGDTINTAPAALMGDAVTVLSSDWSDAYSAATTLSSRFTSNLSINAAIYTGIVPSDGTHYSGGVESFLRLLENWSGSTLTWNGSMVAAFYSQTATNTFLTAGAYYDAPTRKWGFDTNLLNFARLPALSPLIWNP